MTRCNERLTRTLPATVTDSIAPGDDVFVRCPSVADEESLACADLPTLGPPERANVLSWRSPTPHWCGAPSGTDTSREHRLGWRLPRSKPTLGLRVTEDVTAHYHLDPTVHDEVTVRTLAELFDVVYERGETWEVSR